MHARQRTRNGHWGQTKGTACPTTAADRWPRGTPQSPRSCPEALARLFHDRTSRHRAYSYPVDEPNAPTGAGAAKKHVRAAETQAETIETEGRPPPRQVGVSGYA